MTYQKWRDKISDILQQSKYKDTKKGLYWYLRDFTGILRRENIKTREQFMRMTWPALYKLINKYK